MGKAVPSTKLQVRISVKDREVLQDLAEEGGTTVSEVVRQWIAERCRAARNQYANMRAVTMMEGFFGTMGAEMVERGELDAAEALFGMRKGELSEPLSGPQTQDRSSNTGPTRHVSAAPRPRATSSKGAKP